MLVYSALLLLALVAAAPWWLWRMATSGRYRAGLTGRLGKIPPRLDEVARQRESQAGLLWLHAVSVGEVLASQRLVAELRGALPEWQIVISTTTATGQKMAKDRLDVPAFYFPLDFAFAVRPHLRALRPDLFITMESELWPRMLVECERAGVPVAVVNARISDRSLPRYLRLRKLWRPLLRKVALFCAQGQESADRLIAIGVAPERVCVTGNLKYDAPAPDNNAMVRRIGGLLVHTRLIVAGSTLPGEESILLEHWPEVCARISDVALLIAPRHPQRFAEVLALIRAAGAPYIRCSQAADTDQPIHPGTILLLDTLGDLAAMYSIASAAFIGGSLVPKGGHNPLEAVRFNIPVLMGPSFENFREMVEPMLAAGTVTIVKPSELGDRVASALIEGKPRAAGFVGQTGATAKTLTALLELIDHEQARHT